MCCDKVRRITWLLGKLDLKPVPKTRVSGPLSKTLSPSLSDFGHSDKVCDKVFISARFWDDPYLSLPTAINHIHHIAKLLLVGDAIGGLRREIGLLSEMRRQVFK